MSDIQEPMSMEEFLGVAEAPKKTKTEVILAEVDAEDASATDMTKVSFQFRDLIPADRRRDLAANAPAIAGKMMQDYNEILGFGAPVLQKLNQTSITLLNTQRDIEVPEADQIVNNLLRTMDGYSAKYRSEKMEGAFAGIRKFFNTGAYNIKAMARDAKPIAEKIDIAEKSLIQMETVLKDNITRGQELHKLTTETLDKVVNVLAALEEINEHARGEFTILDNLVREAESKMTANDALVNVEYKGEVISINELRLIHNQYATGIKELEQTWFDWRQQFFLGYAMAPSISNITMVSTTLQRRCQTFRTMGLPMARQSLVAWNNAVQARQVAEKAEVMSEGQNLLVQQAFTAMGDSVEVIAKANQTPIVSEETIFTVIDSVRKQCEGLIAADRWGREVRERSLQAIEQGERAIHQDYTSSRRELVEATLNVARAEVEPAPTPEADTLKELGILK